MVSGGCVGGGSRVVVVGRIFSEVVISHANTARHSINCAYTTLYFKNSSVLGVKWTVISQGGKKKKTFTMHSDSWETKWRLNYITNAVTPLPSQSSRTHVARRALPQLLRTRQRDDAGDVSPGILGDASVVAKVLPGQILHVQTHFHLQCKMGTKNFQYLLLYWLIALD